ncbi:hypothetical protein D3C72_1551310 [compost metagenome]
MQLIAEGVITRKQCLAARREAVVGDHCRDRREQANRRGDQCLGDTGRDCRERRLLHLRQADERIHDPPHRAEQADVRTHRADRGEELQTLFQAHFFFADGDVQRPLDAFLHRVGVVTGLLFQVAKFLKTCAKNSFDPGLHILDLCSSTQQRQQLRCTAKALHEAVQPALAAAQHTATLDDQVPAEQRGQQQREHHGFDQ